MDLAMSGKFFNLEEAESLLPAIEKLLQSAIESKKTIDAVDEELNNVRTPIMMRVRTLFSSSSTASMVFLLSIADCKSFSIAGKRLSASSRLKNFPLIAKSILWQNGKSYPQISPMGGGRLVRGQSFGQLDARPLGIDDE